MPSLSLTLGGLTTTTTVEMGTRQDELQLDGKSVRDIKLETWLAGLRTQFDIPPLAIWSQSDFPANSGLASSASGFAALITAVNALAELGLSDTEVCDWARRGSASSARSVYGGFVAMTPRAGGCDYRQVLASDQWDLTVVVAIVADGEAKQIGSTPGMQATRATSPYYRAWINESTKNFKTCLEAVERRDFEALCEVTEKSCNQMHALMLSTQPALRYWTAGTLSVIERVEHIHKVTAANVCYTVDAGCHVKAICLSQDADAVQRQLDGLPEVSRTIRSEIGGAAVIRD